MSILLLGEVRAFSRCQEIQTFIDFFPKLTMTFDFLGVDHFGEWSPWMICKGSNCGPGRRSRTRKVYLSFTRKTTREKNKKAKLMAKPSGKCIPF